MEGKMNHPKLVSEILGGEPYEYYPLGEHVVIAPGVCGGRPTFKGTRFEVQVVMDLLAAGWDVERILDEYRPIGITREAVREAIHLAEDALRTRAAALAA
ncbi:MAG: DUF433 domain-containing protein [Armatimonadetes bacterium]|nr:DUF433 domain-containing protein [Armatimonadota bacterium]